MKLEKLIFSITFCSIKVCSRHWQRLCGERPVPSQRGNTGNPSRLPPLRPRALARAREVHPREVFQFCLACLYLLRNYDVGGQSKRSHNKHCCQLGVIQTCSKQQTINHPSTQTSNICELACYHGSDLT